VTDPILLFLSTDLAALLLLGVFHGFVPRHLGGLATTGLSGLGALLCVPPLLSNAGVSVLRIPLGPPGLPLHLALDPISAFFLLIVLFCGTAVAAFAAAGEHRVRGPATSQPKTGPYQGSAAIPLCLAGLSAVLLAADAVMFALGLGLTSAAISLLNNNPLAARATKSPATLLAALMLLIAVCLLAPSGFTPGFDAIRAATLDPGRINAAVALAITGSLLLLRRTTSRRCWTLDALTAGAIIPSIIYLLIRLVVDLPDSSVQAWWGFVLLLAGGMASVGYAWRAAQNPDLDGSVACLARRQAGLAVVGLGLVVIARSADLPDAASFGLAATLLLTISSGVAGTLASLSAHVLGHGADTYRLARLGGLLRSMPIASVSLAASLLALSALPPAAGFAVLWLLFQSILSAPRTGGLISQLPLALIAAALALSAALTTAAAVRLLGIAVLSRPRSVRGSAAQDVGSSLRPILLALSGLSILVGALPGLALQALADPVVRVLTGTGFGMHAGWATLSGSAASPGYSAMPVLAFLVLAIGSVALILRRFRREARLSSAWSDGIAPSANLPFGDPVTQSVGAGFLPTLPVGNSSAAVPRAALANPAPAGPDSGSASPSGFNSRWRSYLRGYSSGRPAYPIIGLWVILFAFSVLLLVLSAVDNGTVRG